MSKEAKKAAAAPNAASADAQPVSLLDQIVDEGRLARDPEAKETRQGYGGRVRGPVPRREHGALARFRGDDQRPHCGRSIT